MRIAGLAYLVSALCGLCVLLIERTEAACSSPRIRRDYDTLSYDERMLYRKALQLAMDKGYYIKFVEMHTEKMSELEAHRMCMFTYWHRYFLVGFENMLRGLGKEYECITVPYWNHLQLNARAMTGSCTSMENCSMIIRDLGGSTTGMDRGVSINGAWVKGDRCVNAAPLNHFCESSSLSGTPQCAKCLPRNNLTRQAFPPASNFLSVYRQLFQSGDFVSTGKSIEEGVHNSIHAAMGGAMVTLQSPSDPIFWSHHAYIDMLLTIYLRCRVGLGKLTDEQKKNNPFAFVQCPRRDGAGFFTAASNITMRTGEQGKNPKNVTQPSQDLYPFFSNLPNHYYSLSDVTRIGVSSYTYSVAGLVAQLASQCDAAKGTTRRMLRAQQQANRNEDPSHHCKMPPSDATQDTPSLFLIDHSQDHDPDAAKVTTWVEDARTQLRTTVTTSLNDAQIIVQLEKMLCMFYDKCRGGVTDYPEEFKKSFGVTDPPLCKQVMDELKSNSTPPSEQIQLPDWEQLMTRYFPCEVPETPPSTVNDLSLDLRV